MKKFVALWLLSCFLFQAVYPCTTFVLKTNDGIYFGRNLDWVSDHGIILVNQRNIAKSSLAFPPEKPAFWTSKYGSISFNQFGKEFPFGGINEKGLVVEVMRSEAEYAEPDERPIVNELQWVQYQLDNCATVDEVIATDTLIRVGQAHEGLHYLVCDAEGNSAVVEFLNGKMVFYKKKDLPVSVLENEPYEQSLKNYKRNYFCRFTSAANLVKQYNGNMPPIDYSFSILEKVALTAEWSVVYDITKKEIHFRTTSNNKIRTISMDAFDFSCGPNTLNYNMADAGKGLINGQFVKLTTAKNLDVLKKALALNLVELEKTQKELLLDYFKETACQN